MNNKAWPSSLVRLKVSLFLTYAREIIFLIVFDKFSEVRERRNCWSNLHRRELLHGNKSFYASGGILAQQEISVSGCSMDAFQEDASSDEDRFQGMVAES